MITLFTSGFIYDCILEARKRRALPLTALLRLRNLSHCLFNLSINDLKMITVHLKNYHFFSITLSNCKENSLIYCFLAFYSRKEHKLLVFVSGVLRRVISRSREEMRRWRELHNEGLHNLHSSSDIGVIKLKDMRWVRPAAPMEEMLNLYKIWP
jgi:hypothetical protein